MVLWCGERLRISEATVCRGALISWVVLGAGLTRRVICGHCGATSVTTTKTKRARASVARVVTFTASPAMLNSSAVFVEARRAFVGSVAVKKNSKRCLKSAHRLLISPSNRSGSGGFTNSMLAFLVWAAGGTA
uniref:Putative secreted protein n=1 Tax=Rhipicephalus microplus TaxID=6941 RepID=A0A6M2D949_RHIMP